MRRAGLSLQKDRPALPLLTPEYQHDVAGFSRRFFRELFGLLPDGAAVVLDNYQEVDAQHPFHALVADAIAEIPAERDAAGREPARSAGLLCPAGRERERGLPSIGTI